MPINQGPFNQYLQPQREVETPQPTGWEHPSGGVANILTSFLSGARRGRIEKFQKDEAEREKHQQAYQMALQHIASSNLTEEHKQALSAPLFQGYIGQIAGTDTLPVQKGGHPLANFIKDSAISLTGGQMPKRGAPLDHMPVMEALASMSDPTKTIDYALDTDRKAAELELQGFDQRRKRGEIPTKGEYLASPGIAKYLESTKKYQKTPSFLIQSALNSAANDPQNPKDLAIRNAYSEYNQAHANPNTQQAPQSTVPSQPVAGTNAPPQVSAPSTQQDALPTIGGKPTEPQVQFIDDKDLRFLNITGSIDKATHNVQGPNDTIIPVRNAIHPVSGEQFSVGFTPEGRAFKVPQHYPVTGNATQAKPAADKWIPSNTMINGQSVHGFANPATDQFKTLGANPVHYQKQTVTYPDGSSTDTWVEVPFVNHPGSVQSNFQINGGQPTAPQQPVAATSAPPQISASGISQDTLPTINGGQRPPVSPIPAKPVVTFNTAHPIAGSKRSPLVSTNPQPGPPVSQFDVKNPLPKIVLEKSMGATKAAPQDYNDETSFRGLAQRAIDLNIDQENFMKMVPNKKDRDNLSKTLQANGFVIPTKELRADLKNAEISNRALVPLMEEFARVYRPGVDELVLGPLGKYIIKGNHRATTLYNDIVSASSLAAKNLGEVGKVSDKDTDRIVLGLTSPSKTPQENQAEVENYKRLVWDKTTLALKGIGAPENQAKYLFNKFGMPWQGYGDKPMSGSGTPRVSLAPLGVPRPGSGSQINLPVQ